MKLTGAPRLLIVEDEPALARAYAAIASRFCVVTTASTAEEAIALLESSPVDTVLTDGKLASGHGGMWLLEQITRRWPMVRRCFMSGGLHEGENIAAQEFFLKPLSKADLQRAAAPTV